MAGGGDALASNGAPQDPQLARLARSLGERVRFLGSLPHHRLPLYFSAADVTVVPSFYESFGLVAAEALACGCPVVASRVGGLAEVVQHGRDGLHIPPRDPDALADALSWLLRHPDRAAAMGRHGAASAARRFAWPNVARVLDRLYTEVTADAEALCSGR